MSGHFFSEADALGDTAVFGIIEAGVCYLEAGDWRLYGWDHGCEAGLAYGLSVAQTRDVGGEDVFSLQMWIDPLEVAEGLV